MLETGEPEPRGRRVHKYRSMVLAALLGCAAPVSAQSVFAALRSQGERVGLSTVYRELHALVEAGVVSEAFVAGESLYRVSGTDLLVCDGCGRTTEVAKDLVPSPTLQDFFDPGRPVAVHGTCRLCAGEA